MSKKIKDGLHHEVSFSLTLLCFYLLIIIDHGKKNPKNTGFGEKNPNCEERVKEIQRQAEEIENKAKEIQTQVEELGNKAKELKEKVNEKSQESKEKEENKEDINKNEKDLKRKLICRIRCGCSYLLYFMSGIAIIIAGWVLKNCKLGGVILMITGIIVGLLSIGSILGEKFFSGKKTNSSFSSDMILITFFTVILSIFLYFLSELKESEIIKGLSFVGLITFVFYEVIKILPEVSFSDENKIEKFIKYFFILLILFAFLLGSFNGNLRNSPGDNQTLTGDDQTLTGDDQTLTGDDQTLTGDDQTLTGDDQTLTGDNKEKVNWFKQELCCIRKELKSIFSKKEEKEEK